MKQVIQSYRTGKIDLGDISTPAIKPDCIIIKNASSAVSIGTEKLMISTGKKSLLGKAASRPDLVRRAYEKAKKEGFISVFKESMNRLDEPVPLGYSSAGIVEKTGDNVSGFKVGDKVACAGAGFASHAEYIRVPEEFCVKIPGNVDFESASFNMIGAIAVNGIRQAKLKAGSNVAVVGLGLIGLITVQILKAEGYTVIGIDLNEEKVKLAKELGADSTVNISQNDAISNVENATKGQGVNAVIITAASNDNKPVLLAENICGMKGRIVLVGMADLKFTRKTFWEKELEFVVSKAAGPEAAAEPGNDCSQKKNIEYFLKLLSEDKVKLDKLITHRFKIGDALKCYNMILKNKESYIGVVFSYDGREQAEETSTKTSKTVCETGKSSQLTNIGIIGGGLFTKNILLPVIKKIDGINLTAIATTKGISSNHLAKKFNINYSTSDYKEILNNNSIDSIIITTPHNLHAQMVIESLKAGKNVFVEKPLCLTMEELDDITRTFNSSGKKLMVGFNRRYSPLAQEVKSMIKDRSTPLVINYRVNAGYIPEEHWTQNLEVGGGRIIGEVCHFVDFLQFLTDSTPETVFACSINGNTGKYLKNDNISAIIKFSDGSIGNIIYTAKGPKAYSRERVEVFCEDSVAIIDDFRKVELIEGSSRRTIRKTGQNLGYQEELIEFTALQNKKIMVKYKNIRIVTKTTICLQESIEKGSIKILE